MRTAIALLKSQYERKNRIIFVEHLLWFTLGKKGKKC